MVRSSRFHPASGNSDLLREKLLFNFSVPFSGTSPNWEHFCSLSESSIDSLCIYTDGSFEDTSNCGGWGIVFKTDSVSANIRGGFSCEKLVGFGNPLCFELTAIAVALNHIKTDCTIFSDCKKTLTVIAVLETLCVLLEYFLHILIFCKNMTKIFSAVEKDVLC